MENILTKNIDDLSDRLGSEVEQSIMRLFMIVLTSVYMIFWAPKNISNQDLILTFSVLYIYSINILIICIY